MVEQKKQIIELFPGRNAQYRFLKLQRNQEYNGMLSHEISLYSKPGNVRKIQMGICKEEQFLLKSLPVSGFIDISSDPIDIVNHNLEIQYLNSAALPYFSLSPSQIIGEKLSLETLPLISHQRYLT